MSTRAENYFKQKEFHFKCDIGCCIGKWLVRTPTTAQPRSVSLATEIGSYLR